MVELKVELFAGTSIEEACEDMCALADRVGCLVSAKFNDVTLWARPGNNWEDLVDAWREQLERPIKHYKIAQVKNA